MDELRVIVNLKNPDGIALTETWTNSEISDDYLGIDGYELIERKDREDTDRGRGGGILVYVAKGKCAWKEKVEGCFEQCALVKLRGRKSNLGIYIIYRSPNSSSSNDASLCDLVKEIQGSTVIIGDFNYPGIRWTAGTSDAKSRAFYEELEDNFFIQHVDEPTHKSGNILDLILSKDENIIDNVEHEGRLGKSDHEMLMVTMRLETIEAVVPTNSRDYDRGNFVEMRKEMKAVAWDDCLDQVGVEESWSIIRGKLEQLVEKWVPWRRKKRGGGRAPKWMNQEIRKSINDKKAAWKRWKRTGREEDRKDYLKCETKTKKLIRNRKNALERQVARDSKTNPKSFFSYVNSARRNRNSIGPLSIDDKLVVKPKDQADALNNYFSSVFTRCNIDSPPKEQLTGIDCIDVYISEECVKDGIGRLRKFAAPGPDNITNRILIELCDEVAKPLALLFRKSLDSGKIPDDWRLSNVSPIYKQKGSKAQPGNYRPVSLTSNVCKLMEKVINQALGKHLESGVLYNTQHGFRRGRSCQTNLIEFFDQVTQWMDEGACVDVLYLDFRKAFDKVDHSRLMVKLAAAGVKGKLWRWLKDWLEGRKQRVVVGGEASDWHSVDSGVPQGTVLGGPLFDVYVDDIDLVVLSFLRKFADDTKMAKLIRSLIDAERLQEDINNLCKWAKDWAMEFNEDKCKIMHLGRNNPRHKYLMNGVELSVTEEERDLGIWTESSLKPGLQCSKAASSANKVMGLILKSFHYRTKQTLVPLYKTLVRPKLEFGAAAWNPWYEKDVTCLEKVQKRLIRSLSNVRGATYEEKLDDAGLTTLAERRKRGDLIEAFKTLNGINNVNRDAWFQIAESSQERTGTRSNTNIDDEKSESRTNILIRGRARTEIRNNSFRFRVGRMWNELPDYVRQSKSTNGFKNAYDSWHRKNPTSRNQADT